MLKRRLYLLLTFGFLIFIPLSTALSQTPTPPNYDVTVSPVFFDLTANPGDKLTNRIRIRNNTNSPLPIRLEVKKLTGDEAGNLTLREDDADGSLSWITFANGNTLVATPLEWTNVPFTIEIPKEAAYGYYFAISFTQNDASPLARTGAKITGAAAVPILLNVKKEGAKIQGNLLSFTADKAWYEYPPINLKIDFQNTGNVHIRPAGNIFIKDSLGREVAVLPVNEAQGAILPNTTRAFDSSWDDSFITVEPKMDGGQVLLDKNGKPQTYLKINWTKILDTRIGKYTATALLILSTPERDIPYQKEISFWVFPWKVVLGTLLFVIFAFIGFYSTFRNVFRRVVKLFRRNS